MNNYYGYGFNRMEITRVNGENGARMYQMPPNSQTLLMDETAPLIWLATTDGAGYKTLTPYQISEYKPTNPMDGLEERIRKLEEYIYDKSNVEQTTE